MWVHRCFGSIITILFLFISSIAISKITIEDAKKILRGKCRWASGEFYIDRYGGGEFLYRDRASCIAEVVIRRGSIYESKRCVKGLFNLIGGYLEGQCDTCGYKDLGAAPCHPAVVSIRDRYYNQYERGEKKKMKKYEILDDIHYSNLMNSGELQVIENYINQIKRLNHTPIMIAAGLGHYDAVTEFARLGADLEVTDEAGTSLRDILKSRGKEAYFKRLEALKK